MMPRIGQPMLEFAPGFFAGQSPSAIEILLIQAGDEGITVSIAVDEETTVEKFPAGWSGLLVLDRVACEVIEGRGKYCLANMAMLAKLQAFVDAGLEPSGVKAATLNASADANTRDDAPRLIAIPVADSRDTGDTHCGRALERCFLLQSFDPSPDFIRIAAALRFTEFYQLVRFLLKQPATMTMQDLSERYGLSYSYFRKLCREAFGRGGKAEFQQWRNVRALLDMVDTAETGGSMTDVALRQGFASSSHFSDAMKGQFGRSPRHLTRPLSKEINDL
jgi:AraC-like DNA-binding protein